MKRTITALATRPDGLLYLLCQDGTLWEQKRTESTPNNRFNYTFVKVNTDALNEPEKAPS